MKTLTFLVAFVLSTVSLMAQDIPLQKPELFRKRDLEESRIRTGREPLITHSIEGLLRKIDDADAEQRIAVVSAANKYVPDVTWHSESVVSGNFTCRGRAEQAVLGITAEEIVVVVFINGLENRPESLRVKAHNPADSELTVEDLDYDPKEQSGVQLAGFVRSTVCKGLNIADHHVNLFHLYWNHKDSRFDRWSR
jgi:hypothetical protein